MVRSLTERLATFGCRPEIVKCALTADDVRRYELPSDFTKKSDSRSGAFVAKHGDMAVELDALPDQVLRNRLKEEVESRMDLGALATVREEDAAERARLLDLVEGLS